MVHEKNAFRLFAAIAFALIAGTAGAGEVATQVLIHEETLALGQQLAFENLLGSTKFKTDPDSNTVTVKAQVVAEAKTLEEAQALADAVSLVREVEGGEVMVHVAFPVDRYTAFRMPRSEKGNLVSKWVTPVIKKKKVAVEYDDRMIQVGEIKGAAALSVNLEITIPLETTFSARQIVGSISGSGLRGHVSMEIVEGSVFAEQVYGSFEARSGGGDIQLHKFRGEELYLQTSSGTMELIGLDAKRAELRTGSGPIRGGDFRVSDLRIDSGSGNIKLDRLDTRRIDIKSVTGDVDLASELARTERVTIESDSGDVILRISRMAPFGLRATTQKGSVKAAKGVAVDTFEDVGDAILVRRRTGGTELQVTTVSGAVQIRPL